MATTPERWGIKSYDDQGYINLHSDYSSIVYYGEMRKNTDPVRPVFTGSDYISISEAQKTSNYDMGWLVQFKITGVYTDYMLPFYRPNYSGQQIAILDVIKQDATTWIINVIYQGQEYNLPRLFAFAPLNTIPVPVPETNGIQVFDQAGSLVFTGNKRPLRVDDVILIQHPDAIKTGGRGGCGNDHGCHVDFNSDQYSVYTGTTANSNTKLYHMVPSAYGGLAYKNSGTGSKDCDTIDLGPFGSISLGSREYAWLYQSWASFRGTVGHEFGTYNHKVDWLGDFAGAVHKYGEGGCKIGGWAGAFIGGALAVFTLGASLVFFIGGALAGFALTQGVEGVPSIRAYEADQVYDTNNPSNLIVTDAAYYGIDGLSPPREIVPAPVIVTPYDPTLVAYVDSGTNEQFKPGATFWIDNYDGPAWVSTGVKYDDFFSFVQLNTDIFRNPIYDLERGFRFVRGRLVKEYPGSKLYGVIRQDFPYNSPPGYDDGSHLTTLWRIRYGTFITPILEIRYEYRLLATSPNLTWQGDTYTATNISNSNITSYTTWDGKTFIRGALKATNIYAANYPSNDYAILKI